MTLSGPLCGCPASYTTDSRLRAAKSKMEKQQDSGFFRHSSRAELGYCLGLVALILLTLFLYWPGLTGPLLLDDLSNLRPLGENGGISNFETWRAFVFGSNSGPTGRPVAMLSFLIDAQDWPPRVAALKYTNLMIHNLCGLSICWFSFLLAQHLRLSRTHSAQVAILVAGLWLLHPLNTSTTLYVVQRMTQLMTFFATLALVCYLGARRLRDTSPNKATLLFCCSLFPLGLLSVLSKENGALLLALIVLMEVLFFRELALRGLHRLWYRVGVLFPLLLVLFYLAFGAADSMALYDTRDFNLWERLLTETRALSIYLWKIFVPTAYGNGLFHDDFTVSRSLFEPLSTLLAVTLIAALLGSAIYLRRIQAVYSFAVFWFFTMHLLESSYIPLELYFEHRNYLAMVGPLFALAWYLRRLLSSEFSEQVKQSAQILTAGIVLLAVWSTWSLTTLWSEAAVLYSYWAEERPTSIRAQVTYSDYLRSVNLPELAMQRLTLAQNHYPNEVTILLYQWNHACEFGLESPRTLGEITDDPLLEYYRDNISLHLRILLENLLTEKCEYPDQQTLVNLFNRIGEFSISVPRRAAYYFYFSDLHVYFGNLDQALINLTRAFELNPVPQIPIRQAIMSASAGNYSDALVFLDRAKIADNSRTPFIPSVMDEISRLEQDFQRLNSVN